MYMLFLAAALAVAPRPAYPASVLPPPHTLTGRVADSSGTALADVRVRVLELGRGTTTDAEGNLRWPVPSGTSEVTFADRPPRPCNGHRWDRGHRPRRRDACIGGGAARGQVTVVERRTALTSPQPTGVLAGDQPSPRHRRLARPSRPRGVHSINEGLAIRKPIIRGLSSSRVLVLDNDQQLRRRMGRRAFAQCRDRRRRSASIDPGPPACSTALMRWKSSTWSSATCPMP
jgi:hypothetical protein